MTQMCSGLHMGQQFLSLEDFKIAVRSISVRQHWELRVTRSNKKSVVIGCRSSANCFFRVVCRSNKNAIYITSLQDNHSCRRSANSPGATPARSEASHVRFLQGEIPRLFDMKSNIKAQDVVDAVKRYHGYDISMRQAQRALSKLQPRQAEGQVEQGLDLDLSVGEQQSPEPQEDAAQTYEDIAENRWLPDHLPQSLIGDNNIPQNETASNQMSAPSSSQALPAHAQQPLPTNPHLTHTSHPISLPQPGSAYQATVPLPSVPEPSKNQDYTRNDHTAVPPMVLTNLKIEFTCTTCGSLNQSFFPYQGTVPGAGYLTHGIPNSSNIVRHAEPQTSVGSSNAVSEDTVYDNNASNPPVIQNAWAAGGLGAPIGSTTT